MFRGFVSLVLLAVSLSAVEAQWLTDYEAALKQAQKEGKLVLLDFTGSSWCPACIKTDEDVFSKPEFSAFAAQNLILVKLDFASPFGEPVKGPDAEVHLYLAQRLGVKAFPTFYLLSPNGVPLASKQGAFAASPAEFAAWVRLVQESQKTKAHG